MKKPDWTQIRAHAEATNLSDAGLSKLFGVTRDAVRKRRNREGWIIGVKSNAGSADVAPVVADKVELTEHEKIELTHISQMLNVGLSMIRDTVTGADNRVNVKAKEDLRGSDYKAVVDANKDLWARHKELMNGGKAVPDAASKYIKKEDKRRAAVAEIQRTSPFKPMLVKSAA